MTTPISTWAEAKAKAFLAMWRDQGDLYGPWSAVFASGELLKEAETTFPGKGGIALAVLDVWMWRLCSEYQTPSASTEVESPE